MFKATIQTVSRAKKRTWVYVVDGVSPEPLLREDTEDLGIIKFHLEEEMETAGSSHKVGQIKAETGHH